MINIEEFLVEENGSFIADLEDWKHEDGLTFEHGDRIRFKFKNKKYIGTLDRIGKSQSIFKMVDLKEL